jgi:cysteine-rich repeat protein
VTIGGGETQEIRITLVPDFGEGECGDGFLSPDEQCEDGNTMPGDGCSPACRTETIVLSTSSGAQDAPSLGGAPGRRWVSTFDSDGTTVHIRLLAPDGTAITSPSVLMMDAPLSGVLPTGVTGVHALSSVAVSNAGRVGVSFTTVPEIMVAFLDENRTPEGGAIEVSAAAGTGKRSRVAFAGDGTFLVVFEDDESTTGLSGIVFAAGSRSPGTPFPIGASAANEPAIAGAADHFVVAFASGGDVFVQRFSTDGSARDASPVAVLEDGSGTQDQPSVAALADGRVLVAWRDAGGDGAGTAIRARIFAADGAPDGAAFVVNSTTTGDQSAPSVAATGNVFVVAFESAGSVRARFISSDGSPVPNREQPPSTADFEVAAHGVQPSAAAGGVERANVLIAWAEGGDVRARAYPLR